jgi:hypothetical protein
VRTSLIRPREGSNSTVIRARIIGLHSNDVRHAGILRLNGVCKHHDVHRRNSRLSVNIILDGGGSSWSEDEVLRVLQGPLGPLVS